MDTPKDADFDVRCEDICNTYHLAMERAAVAERTVSFDEMTGIQALEPCSPTRRVKPGQIEKREFEYSRHGTQALLAGMDVVTGEIIALVSDTRTEADFEAFLHKLLGSGQAERWHIVLDNLNTHMSEAAVRVVAAKEGTAAEKLGEKERSGILKSMATRAAYLAAPEHKVIFHYTPKHASWLNQIEIWFSILARRFLRRNSFSSKEELRSKLYEFIDFFNKNLAKPFRWTYRGRPLQA